MAIEFRDVTQLEPLEALEDGDYLVVVRDGVAKRISKTNAKFGGGAMVVTFTVTSTGLSADKTVEEVTTAMASMPVIGNLTESNGEKPVTVSLGACCVEISSSNSTVPAFGPFFVKSSSDNGIAGFVGVGSNGEWEFRGGVS